MSSIPPRIVMNPTRMARQSAQGSLTVARDVVRRRIDPGGTKESPSSARAPTDFVAGAGVEDPEALKR